MYIRTPSGAAVPFSEVAELRAARSPSVIERIDRRRVVDVTGDINKESANMAAIKRDLNAYLAQLSLRYPGVRYSLEGEAREQRESFASLGLGLVFLSVLSLMGMLALIGVVVNDSLVLVDYVNRRRAVGESVADAVRTAGVARFRAVMLTSLTTFAGLTPIIFEKATQAQFLIPMAVSPGVRYSVRNAGDAAPGTHQLRGARGPAPGVLQRPGCTGARNNVSRRSSAGQLNQPFTRRKSSRGVSPSMAPASSDRAMRLGSSVAGASSVSSRGAGVSS